MELFTEADILACWPAHSYYLMQLLNGEYKLTEARADLRSLIGSKWDPRTKESNS